MSHIVVCTGIHQDTSERAESHQRNLSSNGAELRNRITKCLDNNMEKDRSDELSNNLKKRQK